MPEDVKGELEDGSVLLIVCYGPGEMLSGSKRKVGEQLTSEYDAVVGNRPEIRDCIVLMKAQTAGSAFVRGLFQLWQHVRARSGKLVCANYPPDYIDSILTLGLPDLEGFEMAKSKSEALRQLKRRAVKKPSG